MDKLIVIRQKYVCFAKWLSIGATFLVITSSGLSAFCLFLYNRGWSMSSMLWEAEPLRSTLWINANVIIPISVAITILSLFFNKCVRWRWNVLGVILIVLVFCSAVLTLACGQRLYMHNLEGRSFQDVVWWLHKR